MKTFKQFLLEVNIGAKYTFGGTAFGNADIDKVTASDQAKADRGVPGYRGFNQRVGSSGRQYIPGYSIANNKLPAGTIVKITDKRTGQPVGAEMGNANGIYRVDGRGGKQVYNNIDFYSGSNKQMMDYYAKYGTNSNNLQVEVLNIRVGSAEEQKILNNLNTPQNIGNNLPPAPQEDYYETPADALMGLSKGMDVLSRTMGGGIK